MPVRRALLVLVLVAALVAAVPSAAAPTDVRTARAAIRASCHDQTVRLPARWWFPGGEPRGLVWVQHGFARTGERVADLAGRLAEDGFLVVAPTLSSVDVRCGLLGRQGFLDRFPAQLAAGVRGEHRSGLLRSARRAAGRAGATQPARLPERFELAGHSAGGPVVTALAAAVLRAPGAAGVDLRGVLLLDPVEDLSGTLRRRLPDVLAAGVPVRTISSPPSACNAGASGTRALVRAATGFAGVTLVTGSHVDAEGASTDVLGQLVCGRSDPANVAVLQHLARAWLGGWNRGRLDPATEPGGAELEDLRADGVLTYVIGTAPPSASTAAAAPASGRAAAH